ncbi:MotE family protein [Rhizobium sp. TH2]|uniref:MotE family protein n=1 Tax=Rhizobium sp. TH2 TaxID=2775403 RepID=UPI0021576424|nr:MotE family protein [Rhizobium sp. TH2]UVC09942.1 MotE family protein [Rhizobium sp. TH2]
MTTLKRFARIAVAPALVLLVGSLSGALALEEKPKPAVKTAREEIKAFCANIADSARDQRYLLQREELAKLQAQVDDRIAQLEKRKSEYEGWLKQRNDFLKKAEGGLVDIYKGMKPDAAAGQLNLIDPNLASAIIMKLSPRQSSQILAEMDPKKAAALTEIISAAGSRNMQRNPS